MPASNARALDKAQTLPADVLIFDLEDAVAPDAKPAARGMAVAAARGESLDRVATGTVETSTGDAVPAVLLTPVSVTVDNIPGTLVKDRAYTIQQICSPQLEAACKRAGLI